MKTLKNIHEGFFSNVGATGALYKNKIIEYLENIKNVNTKSLYIRDMGRYTLEEAIKEVKRRISLSSAFSWDDGYFANLYANISKNRNV